jgi:hypothetical protein
LVGLRAPGTFSADDTDACLVLAADFRTQLLAGDHGIHPTGEEIHPLVSLAAVHPLACGGISVDAVSASRSGNVLVVGSSAAAVQGDYLPPAEVRESPDCYLLVRDLPWAFVFYLVRTYAAQQLGPFLAHVANYPRGSLPCA